MSDYFDYSGSTRILTGTRGRAAKINAIFDLISAGFDKFPDEATLNAYFASISGLASGSGVVISSNDTTSGYLNGKLVAGEGIDLTENNDGGAETLTVSGEDATDSNKGIAELATNDETVTGTDTSRVCTPANLTAKMAAPGAVGETTPGTMKLANAGLKLVDLGGDNYAIIKYNENATGNKTLNLLLSNGDRTFTLSGNLTVESSSIINQDLSSDASPTFNALTLTTTLTLGDLLVLKALRGGMVRSTFRWKDGNEIYIGEGRYYHKGTTTQALNIISELIFVLESAGSNADSDDFGADGWHYIYIDDSAVVTQASYVLDEGCFLNSLTPPTWKGTEFGWYNGDDLCVFAVYETGGVILEFIHSGDFVLFADKITAMSPTNLATDWTDEVTFNVPAFVRKVKATFNYDWVDTTSTAHWRTEGQAGTTGHIIATVETGKDEDAFLSTDVIISSNLKIDVKDEDAGANTLTVYADGWYFPNGI